jgi:predicted transcriptional regulator
MSRHRRTDPRWIWVNCNVEPELVERLDDVGQQLDRSRASLLREALRGLIQRHGGKVPEARRSSRGGR